MPRSIPRLDVMIAYSCNLSCAGCISLSDRPREGVAAFADVDAWIQTWAHRITPGVVTLFGGEPCLHPRLLEICHVIRYHWPDAVIRLITNGYLLDNFDSGAWFDLAPVEIQVSVHRSDHEHLINQAIRQILLHRTDWKTQQNTGTGHEQLSWTSAGIRIYKSRFKDFVVPFKLENNTIQPWHSDPAQAHAICGAPDTPVLYKGLLYKCPAVANVMDLTGQNWFGYEPCEREDQLDQFISSIGHAESVCGQCPQRSQAVVVDHFDKNNVHVKQKITG